MFRLNRDHGRADPLTYFFQTWTRPEGEFTVYVGQSAFDDNSLTATF